MKMNIAINNFLGYVCLKEEGWEGSSSPPLPSSHTLSPLIEQTNIDSCDNSSKEDGSETETEK